MESLRHTWFDRVLPWLLGAGVAALAWFTGNSLELPPELWDEIAVAAKLRPPVHEFPLLWQTCLAYLIEWFGISSCIEGLKIAGPVSLGALAILSYRFLEGSGPSVVRIDMRHSAAGRWIVMAILIQCTLMFVCSEPVWLVGRILSPGMLMLLLSFFVLRLAQFSFGSGGALPLMLMGCLSGFLASETLSGILPPLFCGLYLWLKDWGQTGDELHPFADPAVCSAAVRKMTWCFILFLIAGVACNLSFYIANGGGGETDPKVFIAVVKYLLNYINVIRGAASPFGFFLIAAIVALPLMIAAARVRMLVDIDRLLPIPYACFLSVAGVVACSQSLGFTGCHFWRWTPNAVPSQYLLCLCVLGAVTIVLFAMCVFAVDVFFRDHERLMRESFSGDEYENDLPAWRMMKASICFVKVMRPVMVMVPLTAVSLAVVGRLDGTVREMSSIVNDVARQTAAECEGADMLFTDGSLDAAVEVLAKARGCDLKALSMMSRSGRYDVAVRLRGETNEANRALLSIGAADALRTWVTAKDPCVSNIALQVGLELWRRHNLPMPEAGGLVSRTAGYPPGAAQAYAESARAVAGRVLRLYANGRPVEYGYPELNSLFLFAQWRLSRMCRMRANDADGRRDSATSEIENALADRLDKFNPEWQRVQEKMDWIGRQDGMRLTPREGLKLGLDRADFRLARSYARRVVASDADDVQANFALGMGYFIEKQYGRAEMHLKKCLIRAPGEPAVLNNLAIVQLRLGRYADAEANALKALEKYPDSSEIKTTLRHIRSAKDNGARQ